MGVLTIFFLAALVIALLIWRWWTKPMFDAFTFQEQCPKCGDMLDENGVCPTKQDTLKKLNLI
jgi:hypothetical protein